MKNESTNLQKNKFGHCMFGDSCRFRYVDEKCVTQDFEIYKCEKGIQKFVDTRMILILQVQHIL